jgi:tyrosine-protein kinase Etk/Wzc
MEPKKKPGFIDYAILLIKWKKFFIILLLSTGIISYLLIYFFVKEEFQATATVLPVGGTESSGISGLLKNFKGLPIGAGGDRNADLSLYNSIIYSRTLLENVITKFNLIKELEINTSKKGYKELTLKEFRKLIATKVSDDQVYEITVTLFNPVLVTNVTNYIVELLNKTIVSLQISKSKDNREFLEQRYKDIETRLHLAEDSLKLFQEKSGLLDSKEQVKGILSAYSELESSYITKQVELSVMEKISSPDLPQVKNLKLQVDELGQKLKDMQNKGNNDGYLLALNSLPEKASSYIRKYRDVEINSSILEFLVPLYEQAKFQEQKDIPVLQIIDNAVVPEIKSYPPRVLFALIISLAVCIFAFLFISIQENKNWQESDKINWLKHNIFKWRSN